MDGHLDLDQLARERVGSVLDEKWTIEKLLGVGGMAAVYAARHRNGARAAIKILHPEFARNADVRERFRREGYAANLVEHPGVVKVLDDDVVSTGPNAGAAYLVMELLDGQVLQERLENGPPIGEIELLEIASSVLEVLDAAHTRGVVHRDLKPENLFLSNDASGGEPKRRIKVLDFGLARLQEGQSITSYGMALGTPSFMSPEQAAGRTDEIDGRTDLFALGATAFRIRTGRRIHDGATAVDLVVKMATLPAPRIRTVSADVSEPFARVVDRALEFRRDDRYPSAAKMALDVRRALAELEGAKTTKLSGGAPPGAPTPQATIEVGESDIVPTGREPKDTSPIQKRSSLIPWIAVLVLGGVGAGVGAKLWLDRPSAQRTVDATPAASDFAPAAEVDAAASPSLSEAGAISIADGGTATPDASPLRPLAHPPAAAPRVATPKKKTPAGTKKPRSIHSSGASSSSGR